MSENDGSFTLCGRNRDGSDQTPAACAILMVIWLVACGLIAGGSYMVSTYMNEIVAGFLIGTGIFLFIAPCIGWCVIINCALRGLSH